MLPTISCTSTDLAIALQLRPRPRRSISSNAIDLDPRPARPPLAVLLGLPTAKGLRYLGHLFFWPFGPMRFTPVQEIGPMSLLNYSVRLTRISILFFLVCLAVVQAAAQPDSRVATSPARVAPFLGRWDITGEGRYQDHVYWLEVREVDGKLTGTFLNRRGSVLPLSEISIDKGDNGSEGQDDELVFSVSTAAAQPGQPRPIHRARAEEGRLLGRLISGGPESSEIPWIGLRPPQWGEHNTGDKRHRFGTPVQLFNGENLTNWLVQDPERPSGWTIVEGAMTNEAKANNLISKHQFENFRLLAEYKIEPKSNSGIFLRGRYEIQIVDDFGREASPLGHAALYSRVRPVTNASLPPGEWQTLEAIIVGNRLTVTLNGRRVLDNTIIEGITGGALDSREGNPGPIMIQGDHGKVSFRRLTVTPIVNVGLSK